MVKRPESKSVSQFESLVSVVLKHGRSSAPVVWSYLSGWTLGQVQRGLAKAVRLGRLTQHNGAAGPEYEGTAGAAPGPQAAANEAKKAASPRQHPLHGAWTAPAQSRDNGADGTEGTEGNKGGTDEGDDAA